MSAERIDEIEKRLKAATPGPWHWERTYELNDGKHWALYNPESKANGRIIDVTLILFLNRDEFLGQPFLDGPNAQFIAAAPDDIAYLIARVRELEAKQ